MRLIDADKLQEEMYHQVEKMYHEAFETDTDMQKWDSGCWIRYKMVENIIEKQEIIDAEPVVRCKECKFNYANQIPGGDGCQLCVELPISKDFFCAYGEKMDIGEEE